MKVYFISGLAADCRVFKYVSLPEGFEPFFLDWIAPNLNESLQSYALRLADGIDKTKPFALVGLSMGGMIATEIAKVHPVAACILLCSVPTHLHMPRYYRWAFALRLHKMVPVGFLKQASMLKRGFTPDSKNDKKLLRQVIQDSDPVFIRWAMHAILSWQNETIPAPLWHLHGTKDEILPIRFTKPTHVIEGGNHLMIMSKAIQLNEFLSVALTTTSKQFVF